MATLYEITSDLKALHSLLDSLVDENGEPREPTEAEFETMKQWFQESEEAFQQKFDGYCKFIKNLQIKADIVKAEKEAYQKEMSRLSRRATAFENRAKAVKNLLYWNMERLGLAKSGYKTELFSAKEQNTQKTIQTSSTYDWHKIPQAYLKAPELDTQAIKEAVKDGSLLMQKDGVLELGKLYFRDGTELEGVVCLQGKALYIR